jgi:glutamate synthase domain-containing protein 1
MLYPKPNGTLYNPRFEHDACGVGFVADISGAPSRLVLDRALEAVVNLTHRGAVSADAKTGDGAGLLTQIPSAIFVPAAAALGGTVHNDGDLAVGVVFLPSRDPAPAREALEQAAVATGIPALGWRPVPLDISALGAQAQESLPAIEHLLIVRPAGMDEAAFNRRLYIARKAAERAFAAQGLDCYVASLSTRTLAYKGLLVAPQLQAFYKDLHLPHLGAGAALPHAGPQRGDQHPPGQRELDARTRARTGQRRVG